MHPFDVAGCAEAAVIGQTDFLADSNIEFEHGELLLLVRLIGFEEADAENRPMELG